MKPLITAFPTRSAGLQTGRFRGIPASTGDWLNLNASLRGPPCSPWLNPHAFRGCRPVARVALSCTKKIIYFSPEPRHPRLTLSNGKSRLLTPINVQNFRVPNTCSRSLSALGRGYGVRCLRDMTESCGCVGGKVHPGVR